MADLGGRMSDDRVLRWIAGVGSTVIGGLMVLAVVGIFQVRDTVIEMRQDVKHLGTAVARHDGEIDDLTDGQSDHHYRLRVLETGGRRPYSREDNP